MKPFFSFFAAVVAVFSSVSCDLVTYNSQASQDQFVKTILYDLANKQDTGYYLEIGAAEPIDINNTYYFEKNYGWNGISIDISSTFAATWQNKRSNPLLVEDATASDYAAMLHSFPSDVDYLSLDVDGYYDVVLQMLPHQDHIFKVITIEHDYYRFGTVYRNKEREVLTSLGYHLLCGDVSNQGLAFEDWWVHPSVLSPEVFAELTALDLTAKDHRQILSTIRNHFHLIN